MLAHRIGQLTITEPTLENISSLEACRDATAKVYMSIRPPPAKADQFGAKYGNFLVYVKLTNESTNAAHLMLQMERCFPVQSKADRKLMPLFGPSPGSSFTHGHLDAVVKELLTFISTCISLPYHNLHCYAKTISGDIPGTPSV